MSQTTSAIVSTFILQDPTTFVQNTPKYGIFKGSLENTYQSYPSTNFSNSTIQFSIITPSPQTVLDRRIYLGVPIKINFTGDTGDDNIPLLNYGYTDAFRAFPLASIITTLQATINNLTLSIPLNDIFPYLARFQSFQNDEIRYYSTTPCFQDQSQNYNELLNSLINPLGGYPGTSIPYQQKRGEFPVVITQNNRNQAEVQAFILEPLFLSPFLMKGEREAGFFGVQNFTLNITLDSNINRIWSHCQHPVYNNNFSSIQVNIGGFQPVIPFYTSQPTLFVKYAKPNVPSPLEIPSYSPYNLIDRYPTNMGTIVGGGTFDNFASQNIQLGSIPRRLYIYARRSNLTRTYETTDTFAVITNVNITWDTRSGLLSSASTKDLYDMSTKNGLQMSWEQFIGASTINSDSTRITTCGNIICIDFGEDIGLPLEQAPGMAGTFQLLVKASGFNPNSNPVEYTMYVVVISEGIFYTQNLQAFSATGTVTSTDINNSTNMQVHDIQHNTFYGNGIFDAIKKGIGAVARGFTKASPYIQQGLKAATQFADTVADIAGAGQRLKKRKFRHYGSGLMGLSDLKKRAEGDLSD